MHTRKSAVLSLLVRSLRTRPHKKTQNKSTRLTYAVHKRRPPPFRPSSPLPLAEGVTAAEARVHPRE